ncbi:TonB family protein [Arenimonas sp. GDDSR-1]|uniref:energy transducer TonB n=1 Tax=Arenimonas sp. GDDSR-1 TaxID=2950125 RepID=UPI00260FE221|nr:TonB family protein [Arenimonas sp. GDDSR-1]
MTRKVGPRDRLTGTFLLSLIGYGVLVLGVGFTLNKAAPVSPTLDVILSPTASPKPPDQADFLAQANNQGGGDSERPQRPKDNQLSQLPQTDPGDAPVALKAQQTPPEPEAIQRVLTSQGASTQTTPRAQEQKPNSTEPLPPGQELVEQSLALAKLANEYSQKQALQARRSKHKYITASTREYAYAQYMNDWVRRVERIGNANYPQQALINRLSGQLILTVAIRRNGRIEGITVVKSSGNKVLDKAAVDIVRLAEPFAALPETADNPNMLYITRTWQFIAGQTSLN